MPMDVVSMEVLIEEERLKYRRVRRRARKRFQVRVCGDCEAVGGI